MTDIIELYHKYNPITQYVIRPALRFANASDHPIRGGVSAAVSSGLTHYAALEIIAQTSDALLGTNMTDPQTKLAITNLPGVVHALFGVNILSNVAIGVKKYFNNKK